MSAFLTCAPQCVSRSRRLKPRCNNFVFVFVFVFVPTSLVGCWVQPIPCPLDRADGVMDTCNDNPASPREDGRPDELCVLDGGDMELGSQVTMALCRCVIVCTV